MGIADDLRKMHSDVLETIDGLSAEEMNREGTIGRWSARDVLIHMAMWDGEALKALAVWRGGHDYDWAYADDYLQINACWHEITKKISTTQVIQMYNLVRYAIITDTTAISDDVWSSRGGVPKWLSGITIEHNQWHLDKLRAYRKSLGK